MASHSPLAPVRAGNREDLISVSSCLMTEVTALPEHPVAEDQPAAGTGHVGQKAQLRKERHQQLSGAGKAILSELPAPSPQPLCTQDAKPGARAAAAQLLRPSGQAAV